MHDNHPVWSRFKDHVDPLLNTLVMKSPGGGNVGPHLQVIMPSSLYTDPNVTDEDRKQVAMEAASRTKPVDMEHVMPYLMGKHASENARLAVLAHYGLVKHANAAQATTNFFHGANPQQFMRRTLALNGGIAGGLGGTVAGGIYGAYNAKPGERLSGAVSGAGKGLVAGTALGAGTGAVQGHFADPARAARLRETFRQNINSMGYKGVSL
jgi:hypothetical protein